MPRTLTQIQTDICTAADRLETLTGELALASLLSEIERDHFPSGAMLEQVGTDEVCPTVGFETHGDLAGAIEALGEAVDGLRKATGRTAATVREAWRERLLGHVADPAIRNALRMLCP
jgi:hypothetical protein